MRHLQLRRATAGGAIFLSLALAAGTGLVIDRTWHTAYRSAKQSLAQTAEAVENAVNRHILQADGALISLPKLFAAAAPKEGEPDAQSAGRLLASFNFQTFAFRDLLLVAPNGTVWASARSRPGSMGALTKPGDPESREIIGAVSLRGPVRNRLTGEWDMLVIRPIVLPRRSDLLAVAEIPLPFLVTLMAEAGKASGVRIALNRPDGILLASLPHDELQIGLRQPLLDGNPRMDGVAFAVPSSVSKQPAIAVIRHTLYKDIVISATLDLREAMADWERDRNRLVGGLSAAVILVLAFATALNEALRQHDRLETERSLARSVLDSAIEAMSVGFVIWDPEDRLVSCNQRYRDLYKVSAPFIVAGARFEDIVRSGAKLGQYPEAGDVDEFVREAVAWHRSDAASAERLLPDGRWLLSSERRTVDGGTVGLRIDITSLKKIHRDLESANARATDAMAEVRQQNAALERQDHALRMQNRLFDAALNNMSHGLVMTNARQCMIVCNTRFRELFGLAEDALPPGSSHEAMFAAIHAAGIFDGSTVETVRCEQERLASERRAGTFVSNDPLGRSLSITQRPMDDGGWIAIYEDITERQQAEGRIRFMAHYDALTRLPNRVLLRSHVEEMLLRCRTARNGFALLYLDLDRFKDVNDALGHAAGDALLAAAASRLTSCLREGDLAARLGGDEFAIVCAAPEVEAVARALGERVIAALSAPFDLGGRRAVVGASVGIAVATDEDTEPDYLLKKADMALYQAKADGRGICCVFQSDMQRRIEMRLQTEADLQAALAADQLEVFYQPIMNLRSNRLSGFEALVRWHHPQRGQIPPSEFIPLAEQSGLINAIGTFVLQRACAEIAALANVKIAVNLSALQFRSAEVVDLVTTALDASRLHPSRLELEITESALLRDNDRTVALLHRLRTLGVKIVLDDFGTGYSSLSHLRSFPFDKLKIDQSFVREMAYRTDCAAIVRSAVSLADRLGMTTTAEGVETAEQLALVRDAGCSEVQGYLIGPPVPHALAAHAAAAGAYTSTHDAPPMHRVADALAEG